MKEKMSIEIQNLSKIYGDGSTVRALDNVNLSIRDGEFLTVMGPSGSGKSTLLNLVGALDRPSEGQIYIHGQNLADIRDLNKFRAQTVGFIFQMHNLIPTLNALENIEVPMMGQIRSKRHRRKRAQEILELLSLADRSTHLPSQLSGGQRQRVAIGRALANKPAIILADEPTGNLDTQSGDEVIKVLHKLNKELNTTIIIVSHDPAVARRTKRVIVLHDGQIADDHLVGHPFEEDFKTFTQSGLGKALLAGDPQAISWIKDSKLPLRFITG